MMMEMSLSWLYNVSILILIQDDTNCCKIRIWENWISVLFLQLHVNLQLRQNKKINLKNKATTEKLNFSGSESRKAAHSLWLEMRVPPIANAYVHHWLSTIPKWSDLQQGEEELTLSDIHTFLSWAHWSFLSFLNTSSSSPTSNLH